ncbi:hypothetical protein DFQ28_004441 [Apophysomyces sp. BC1034]|nr:hypothetical protein DFQ30_005158 [Apophysomyces sp. BC1015]KAG0178449.1 hypothetical protein DFQ29_003460 [Apophysomyces sp. BC1021]KAG0188713.1 hypothetical protein DFQ28_004441 [Apophysomyces sp. BC1034]
MLLQLPPELLHHVLSQSTRATVAQLCLTCHRGYELCVPVLYAHVELGFRNHFQQLEAGLHRRLLLRQTVERYTKRLSLVYRQSGSHWLVTDVQSLFIELPNVVTLTFNYFINLPAEAVIQLASVLPQVQKLVFRYCNLVTAKTTTSVLENTTSLSLFWTDFSEPAVARLLTGLPHLTQVDFGANHNRDDTANGFAVQALQKHCSRVQDLSVSLQQVSELVLCNAVAFYGPQLRRLSIRCDGPQTLRAVATHASSIECLIVRAMAWPAQSTLQAEADEEEEEETAEKKVEGSMTGILLRCQRLVHLEMASWMIEEIPGVVWRAIETVAQRRTYSQLTQEERLAENRDPAARFHGGRNATRVFEIHPPTTANGGLWSIRERGRDDVLNPEPNRPRQTLALDTEELQEIRKLFLEKKG